MSEPHPVTADYYLVSGYVRLLAVWAMHTRAVQHMDVESGHHADADVWRYFAAVAFKTAEILAEGGNPWETIK